MSDKVLKVLRGYINLTASEKVELITELNKYIESSAYGKQIIEENVQKSFSVGPKNTICNCCGR